MATQNTILPFSGKLGNQIGYQRKKQYFLRAVPVNVKQTTATKRAARDFGTASKCSRVIRHALRENLLHCYDSSLTNRLNKAFGQIVRADVHHLAGERIPLVTNMDALSGFQMNNATTVHQLLDVTPVIEKEVHQGISISLPAITCRNTKAVRGITHYTIRAIALSVNFSRETARQIASETILLKHGEKHPPVTLTLHSDEKEVGFILLEVQSFYKMNGQLYPSQNKKGHALDIIAILPPTEQQPEMEQAPQEVKRAYRNTAPRFWGIPSFLQPVRQRGVMLSVLFLSPPEG
jgi:hypothetical protein